MSFEAVFFDVDGTLLDFESSEELAFVGAFAGAGYYTDEDALKMYRSISKKLWLDFEKGLITRQQLFHERWSKLLAHLKFDIDPGYMNDIYINTLSLSGILFEDALPMLDELYGRVPMSLMTNGAAKAQHGRIKAAGMEKYFEHIFISEELGVQKPNPAFFSRSLEACKISDPSCALIVGDSLSADMAGGAASGLKTCWINRNGAETPTDIRIDYEVDSLLKIPSIILGE